MEIKLLRKIDYWIGIPICFFLSIFAKVNNIFIKKSIKKSSSKKIIFLEFSEMGSALLAYSAIKIIKKFYPNAIFYFWIFKENSEAVELLNIIPKENILKLRFDNLWSLFIDIFRDILRLRREKIDIALDLELFSRFSSILTYLSGAYVRIDFDRYT